MFNEKNLKNATLMQDCENPKKFYLCMEDRRYIFEEGNYGRLASSRAEQGRLKGVIYAYLFG